MQYSVFDQTKNDATKEPMFLGQPVNVARFDQQKHEIFEKLIEKQLSFSGVQKKLMSAKIASILSSFQNMKNIYFYRT